jgi:hypothetical protein
MEGGMEREMRDGFVLEFDALGEREGRSKRGWIPKSEATALGTFTTAMPLCSFMVIISVPTVLQTSLSS